MSVILGEVCNKLFTLMKQCCVEHEILEHPPVSGCDDSLERRKEAGWTGASSKCILFHAKGAFHLVATTSDRSINGRHFKKQFGTKNIRFATPEEVAAQTGCTIGSVPPFLPGNRAVASYVDRAILARGHFMFNPADPGLSVRIKSRDLAKLLTAARVEPTWFADNDDGKLDFFRAGA